MNQGYEPNPDERDLALARRLADGPAPFSGGAPDDEILATLAEFRAVYPPQDTERARSERLWAGIQQAVKRPEAVRAPRVRSAWFAGIVRRPSFAFALATVAVLFVVWFALKPVDPWREVTESVTSTGVFNSDDGSTITLRPNSRLWVRGQGDRAYRMEGEAFFDVAHDPARPFTVEGGGATVTVLGTRFNVSTWGPSAEVYLEEGRISLRATDGPSVDLSPGERATVGADGVALVETGSREDAMDWMEDSLVFSSRPLEVVLAEIEHHYSVTITVPTDLGRELLSGRILLTDLDATLADLGAVLGGRFVAVDARSFRFEP